MKTSNRFPRLRPANAARRTKLLTTFDRSGLSAAEFARQQGLTYSTFCGWRHRRAKDSPGFVQVELAGVPVAPELVIELGAGVRIRISSAGQIELAVRLLQSLNPTPPC
jgi:AraC-like DNA-binding protein